jgi:hypothetical protein
MRRSTTIVLIALLWAVPALADQLIRKGGEWRSTVTGIGPQPQTMDTCFAEATQEQAMAKLAAGKQCSKKSISFSGNVVTIDVVCGEMAMQGTAILSGDSAYTANLTMRMAMNGKTQEMHTVTESHWIGACKPGEVPR